MVPRTEAEKGSTFFRPVGVRMLKAYAYFPIGTRHPLYSTLALTKHRCVCRDTTYLIQSTVSAPDLGRTVNTAR